MGAYHGSVVQGQGTYTSTAVWLLTGTFAQRRPTVGVLTETRVFSMSHA